MYTSQVARQANVHPNTVRLYEAWGFLPPVPRSPAGYRIFTHRHVDQMLLARLALNGPYPGGKEPVLALVFAAAKANVGLIDVPYIDIKNEAGLIQETAKVKALGFSGKAAIHPCQINAIHQTFMPSDEQVAYAKAVMAAVDNPDAGVVVVNNRMVDRPIILACQRTLALIENRSSNS